MNFLKHFRNISFLNYDWLSIKAHYFFFFGSFASVLSFLPVVAKDLGLHATAVGISYTVLPICIFIFKPLFGYLADSFKNIKSIVISLISATVVLLICVSFIKPLHKSETSATYLQLRGKIEKLPFSFNNICLHDLRSSNTLSCIISLKCKANHNSDLNGNKIHTKAELSCSNNGKDYLMENTTQNKVHISQCVVLFSGNFSETICNSSFDLVASTLKCSNSLQTCFTPPKEVSAYSTYQFWTFTLLLVASGTFFTTAMSLTDVACYEILGEQRQYYGRQRLWGTAGTGVSTALAGFFNDLIAKGGNTDYIACYYVMIVFVMANMAIMLFIELPKAKLSANIMSDIKTLVKSPEFIVYGISVFVIGCFSGLLANYLFWYLKDLGANQTLLGLVIAMQCLAAELPFFFFGGWFVKQLGYFNCLTCSFAAFGLRFGLYSLLKNPWLTLPIEILHGVTFAVFYVSKTAFASVYAPPGTEGTVLGILGGLCDGLGYAVGSFLSGYSYDRLGGSKTFLIAGGLGLICTPATFISHFVFKRKSSPEIGMKDLRNKS